MRTTLDEAYIHLSADAASLYRCIGICPLEWIDQSALVVLLDRPLDAAVQLAATLVEFGLLESSERGYELNNAQRLHARTRADECTLGEPGEVEQVGNASMVSLFNHYLAAAAAAEHLITPSHRALRPRQQDWIEQSAPFELAEAAALDWLSAQLPNYMAIIRYAYLDGRHALVCDLAHRLWPLWLRRRHPQERYEAQVFGLAAATALSDDQAYGQMLTALAGTVRGARPQEAHEYNLRAVAHYRATGDSLGLAQALNAVAKDLLAAGDLDRAETEFRQAEQLRITIGYDRGAALSQQGLGLVALARGDVPTAENFLSMASQTLTDLGDHYDAALTRAWHAKALAEAGDSDTALQVLAEARSTMQAATSAYGEAVILEIIGDIQRSLDQVDQAAAAYAAAHDLYVRTDQPAAARMLARVQ